MAGFFFPKCTDAVKVLETQEMGNMTPKTTNYISETEPKNGHIVTWRRIKHENALWTQKMHKQEWDY